ncbi:MAG: hypothetical protein JJ901_11075 [Erythrobacter sp.]|uniref:hypothetical protein n=1 Tax=Erythrobacter sp. TaxID=1042 RepID=UPI001B2A5529|nr:hypothetical protein [Erythrobacter sp.]MBO6768825.1 hypothetical protein [Erythrobacter sp.]
MIDYFALALTHALIMIALFRILVRAELDREDPLSNHAADAEAPSRREARRARRSRKEPGDA